MASPSYRHLPDLAAPRVIVIADDSPWTRDVHRAMRRAGFESRSLRSPEAAALAAGHRAPAVFLLDADLVTGQGLRWLEALRLAAPDTPVVVVAPGDDPDLRLKTLLLGADDCIAAPFAAQEAVVRVRRAAERRDHLRRLAAENREHRARARDLRSDLDELRGTLRRNVALLQRAVDFHQRLSPDTGSDALLRAFLRDLAGQTGIARLAALGPAGDLDGWYSVRAARGLAGSLERALRIPGNGELSRVLEAGGAPVRMDRLAGIPRLHPELAPLAAGGFSVVAPLLVEGRLRGLLLLGEAREGGVPDDGILTVIGFLASALAPTVAVQEEREREAHLGAASLARLVTHLEGSDPYLRGHSLRVARLAEGLGRAAGLEGIALSRLAMAGILHDVGRFEVDAALWTKSEPLTEDDWTLIRKHPAEGARMAAEARWPEPVQSAIRFHHERWDGGGYPEGLAGEAIPLEARILAVADTFEALTSDRAWRPALDHARALAALREDAGTRLDPGLVDLAITRPGDLLLA